MIQKANSTFILIYLIIRINHHFNNKINKPVIIINAIKNCNPSPADIIKSLDIFIEYYENNVSPNLSGTQERIFNIFDKFNIYGEDYVLLNSNNF